MSLTPLARLFDRCATRSRRACVALLMAFACLAGAAPPAAAQGVDLTTLAAHRQDGGVVLDFAANLALSKAVEDALRRGVPVYFVAEATVYRPRWWWRDERVARVSRSWRLSYQPLTSAWRVSLGAFSQSYQSLEEALTAVTRIAHWRVADAGIGPDPSDRVYVEFKFELDSSQLPRPMQLDLAAQAEWHLAVEKTIPVE